MYNCPSVVKLVGCMGYGDQIMIMLSNQQIMLSNQQCINLADILDDDDVYIVDTAYF